MNINKQLGVFFSFMLIACLGYSQAGSTFTNPAVVGSLPYSATGETTCGFGDNYTTANIACTGSYLGGDEKIYSFTPTTNYTGNIDITISGITSSWSGVFVTDDSTSAGTCLGSVSNSSTSDRVISGLTMTSGTTYYILVSTWPSPQCLASYDITINAITCPNPTALGINGVTTVSADLAWTEGGTATAWEVEYGAPGFTQGTSAGTIVPAATNPITISGLTASTNYEYYVRSGCGANDSSIWSGPFGFYTGYCQPNPSNVDGTGITNVTMDTVNNNTGAEAGNYGDYSAMVANFYWPADMMFDIDITLSTGYAYYMHAWVDWNDDLDFDDAGEYYNMGQAQSAVNPTLFNGSIQVPLSASVGAHRIRIGGFWSSANANNPSYCYTGTWASFEDYTLNITTPPTCPSTDSLEVTNITSTGATLGWFEAGTATNWKVEYGAPGFTLGTGDTVLTTTNPLALTSLTPLTNYEFYVRAVCTAGDSSFWNGPLGFTTDCTGPLSGTYTMDPNSAASATNFISMEDFAQALDICGLGGATVLNVVNNGDTLMGPWDLGSITGSSATNTLTVNGNNNLVYKNPSENHFVRLEGTHYLTIDGFNFVNQTTAAVFGIQMKDSCSYITVTNNMFDLGQSTSSASGGVVASNSLTSGTVAGQNAYFVTVSNNEINGGYAGVSIWGGATTGNVISNNEIHDFSTYGVLFRNSDSCIIENNDIYRGNRASHSTFYGIRIGVSTRAIVRGNKIHDSGVGSYTCYPLEMQGASNTGSQESMVYNNQIYNMQSTSTTYGLYFTNANVKYMNVYHNSVILDAGGTGVKRGIYFNTNTDSNSVQNNMVVLTGSGTGVKTGYYINNASSPLASDNNVIHLSGSGTQYFGRNASTNHATLADWQAATSLDAASYESDPFFASPINGDLTPLAIATDNIGTPIAAVTMDASGAARSATTPDAGALEFTGIPGDLELTSVSMKRVDLCYGSADSAFATVTNVLGATVDFSTDPLTIVWNVTGPVNTMDSLVVNSGTMTTDSTFSISSLDMSTPGDYTLSAYIRPNAVNASAANDTLMDAQMETVRPIILASPDSVTVTSPVDMPTLSSTSPLFPANTFFITERCQWAGTATGQPTGGNPAWMSSDDYIEITGAPNSSLEGYTYEMWTGTTQRINFTFGPGTVLSPNGTAIIGTYLGTSSPANFFYVTTSYTTSSGTSSGHILKDPSGAIVDVVGYASQTFSAATGVTAADWSGTNVSGSSSWGIRLTGPDMNDGTGWVKATQDPNVANAGVTVPAPAVVTGVSWDSAGTTVGTTPNIDAGVFTASGVYPYYVTYTNTCGTFMDTVIVTADLTAAMITDSTLVTCNGADNGTATVTASGGDSPYTYLWSNGDVTAMADSLAPGMHTVTVYDANMWPAVATVIITEPTALMATTSSTPSTCGVPSGSATVAPMGGTAPYTYMWSNGDTLALAAALTGGTYSVTVMDANMCSFATTATVSDIGAPTISIAVDSIVACFGGSTGVVTASAVGGSTPYAFAWSSGGTMATENGLAVGTYDVVLTDGSGCVATKSVTMTENSPLLAIVTGNTNPLCFADSNGTASSIAGGGVAPYTYAWSNGDMMANASNLEAGTHMLTVTDAVGCMQATSVIITQPNQLTGAFVNVMDVSCNAGTNGSASVLNAGGTGPYSYSWNNGSTMSSATGLSSGFAAVTVTDANSCMMMDSVEIMEPTALTSAATVVSDVLCNGGTSGQASVAATGGTMPLVYAWSNGSGGSLANGLAAGSYTVTVSDGNNCQTTSSVTVTEPTMLMSTVTGTDISCFGANDGTATSVAMGGTTPYTQLWSNGSTAASQSNLMMGSYSVVITDANGCTTSGMTGVIEPAAIMVDLGGNDILCDGETAVLDAGTGFTTYTWSTGNSNQMDTITAAGLGAGVTQVGVMVTDGNGCMASDSVEITVSTPVSTTIQGNDELCMYELGDLDAGPGYQSYEWSNSSTSQLIKVYPADMTVGTNTFTVTVTNALGCSGDATFDVELHPEVVFNLPADTMVWKDSVFTITADSGYASYLWNTQQITRSIDVMTGGSYSCVVTDANTGCEGEDEIFIEFVLGIGDVDVAELKLYPNPTSDFINLEFKNFGNNGNVEIEILSITGQLVRTVNVDVSASNGTKTIDVSNLAVGTYMVIFEYENEQVVKQFIIK